MLDIFHDERLTFRINALYDAFIHSNGIHSYIATTENYVFHIEFIPEKKILHFTDESDFSFSISFSFLQNEIVFQLNDKVVYSSDSNLFSVLSKISTDILSSYSCLNTKLREKHTIADSAAEFSRLCTFTNLFFEKSSHLFQNVFWKKTSAIYSDDFYTIRLKIKDDGFVFEYFSNDYSLNTPIFSLEQIGDAVLLNGINLSFTKILLQENDSLFFDLGALYFYDFFIHLLYRHLLTNNFSHAIYRIEEQLITLEKIKQAFPMKKNFFPSSFVFKKDVINFEFDKTNSRMLEYSRQNNNDKLNPFSEIVEKELKQNKFFSDNYNDVLNKTSLDISAIPSERLSHLDISSENNFSYESVKDLPFIEFLHVLNTYSFMNEEIKNSLERFIKTYRFVSDRTNLMSLMSKHFVFVNVPDDFKDFVRILFSSPSITLFEDKFLSFINNYQSKLKEIESSIEKQLSDELDILLTFAEKRSAFLKDNIVRPHVQK